MRSSCLTAALFGAALLFSGVAFAGTNSATYESDDGSIHLTATITVPDAVDVDTDFEVGVAGEFVKGGGVNRFQLWRDAEWSYDSLHRVVVTPGTGTLVAQDLFFFGDLDDSIEIAGGLPEGTYTFTLVFGRSFAHSAGNVGVDIELIVGSAAREVAVDVKPRSCPNPVNVSAGGVVTVAVLGAADLDVADVDADTMRILGVAPLRWSVEDVAAPYDPDLDPGPGCCSVRGPDGYADLVLKFDKQALVAALGTVQDGDELLLTLSGALLDGTPIEGRDCIVIRKKGR